ncbi:MAG: hypothetical protein ABSD90_14170 [Methylocystis sp.]|jgi:hypothetical protein
MNMHFTPRDAPCDDASLRLELARKIQERNLTLQRRDKIAAAIERADALVAGIQGELTSLSDTDAKIASARASSIKAALDNGDEMPSMAIPPALQKLAAQKLNDENRLSAANSARDALLQELAEANAVLSTQQQDVTTASELVAAMHAERLAIDLHKMEDKCAVMRSVLMSYTAVLPGNRRRPASSFLLSLCREPPANASIRNHAEGDVARWRKWTDALCDDAESPASDMVR